MRLVLLEDGVGLAWVLHKPREHREGIPSPRLLGPKLGVTTRPSTQVGPFSREDKGPGWQQAVAGPGQGHFLCQLLCMGLSYAEVPDRGLGGGGREAPSQEANQP